MRVRIQGELTAIGQDCHFDDESDSLQDEVAGSAMGVVIGELGLHKEDSAVDQWIKVVKALRVHGFAVKIVL